MQKIPYHYDAYIFVTKMSGLLFKCLGFFVRTSKYGNPNNKWCVECTAVTVAARHAAATASQHSQRKHNTTLGGAG